MVALASNISYKASDTALISINVLARPKASVVCNGALVLRTSEK